MIAGLLLTLALSAGFALPFSALGLGGAMALGAAVLTLALFSATVFAGLAVSTAGWLVMAAAAASAMFGLHRATPSRDWLFHPVALLPLLIIATALARGVPEYLPVNWDEMSGWASWVRQIMAADTWLRTDMESAYPHYTKAWPILAAVVNRVAGGGGLSAGIGALAALHAIALGAFYDLAARLFSRNLAPATGQVLAWIVLLVLLTGEASWKLVPHSYLIEHPQLYPAIGFLCLAALALGRKDDMLAWWATGLVLASAYAIKTPMAALAASALVMTVLVPERRLRVACGLFTPLALVVVGWSLAAPPQPTNPISWDPERLTEVLARLAVDFPAYLFSWKIALTAVGALGMAAALWPTKSRTQEERGLSAGLTAFTVTVWVGLIPLYLFVISPGSEDTLPSLPRYMGVPLRLIHLFGPLLAVAALTSLTARIPLIRRLTDARAAMPVLVVAALTLAGLQAVLVSRQIAAMADHPDFGSDAMDEVRRVVAIMPTIDRAVTLSGEERPRVLILDQGMQGFTPVIAHHYSIRAPGTPSAHVHRFELMGGWSYGPTPVNGWMLRTDSARFREIVSTARIIWLSRMDAWAAHELAPLIGTCPGNLAGRVLLRSEDGRFNCLE